MDKVFRHFNIQTKLYDIDSNLIYKHNTVNFNCHSYITFNLLMKNSHIYTLNHNLTSLKRKDSVDELYKFRIGNNYYINNREEHLKDKIIDGIDDVMSLKDEEEYRLVLTCNDLNKAIYEMKRTGYEPQVKHTAGRAVEIKFDLTHKIGKKQKTVTYSIVTQHRDRKIESVMISLWKQRNNTTKSARQCSSFMSQFSVKIINHTITKLTLKHWMNAEPLFLMEGC